MQIGSAWTKTEEKEGKKSVTSISISLDDAITEICPQLKGVRFSLKHLTQEQRGEKENAPHWKVTMYKPQERPAEIVSDEDINY
ncbi:hypothetical protein IJI31_01080 [bacterium]|nr:hypothetical protein [bacterium]